MNAKPYIIGIAGASGSGKTTFASNLANKFPQKEVLIISQDSYYKDLNELSLNERAEQNFDHPSSLDFNLLKKHINDLKNGESILQPVYNFNTHSREPNVNTINPVELIIVEGTLLFSQSELLDEFDKSIFIHMDQNTCLERRIKRDLNERGRTKENVLLQYKQTVEPMFNKYINPTKKLANLIINGIDNEQELHAVYQSTKAELKKRSSNLY